jgi:hypothetical protein
MADQYANWLGLLKWSLAQTGDGTVESEFREMTAEDRNFLENVMKEATSDPERLQAIMAELISKLGTSSESRDDETEILLEDLLNIVEQIDMAQVFVKFGGTKCLLLTAKETNLSEQNRGTALSIIGTLAQNNEAVQKVFLAQNILLELTSFSAVGGAVWAKALYAISCSVRSCPEAEALFMERYLEQIFSSLHSVTVADVVKRRCVYFALALLSADLQRADALLPFLLPTVFKFLESNDLDLREGSLRLIACLAQTEVARALIGSEMGHFLQYKERDEDFFGSAEQR